MADKLLTSLPSATTHDGTEKFYTEQGGHSRQSTGDQIIERCLQKADNLAALDDPAAARDNLELGDAAVRDVSEIIALVSGGQIANGLSTGGQVAWVSGLQFIVSAATYYIDGVLYASAEQTITLDAADATLDRIDVIALDVNSNVVKVTGTAAASPSEPDIDPSTQLKLTFVLVQATETAPGEIIVEDVYLEDAEWTSSTSGSGFNAASTNNPYAGTKDIEGTSVANGAYVQLQRASSFALDDYDLLRLFIRSKASWATARKLRLQFFLNGVAKGLAVTLGHGYWGFDSTNTASYQFIGIPMGQFALPVGQLINQLRITDVGGSIGFYIDNITIQGNGASVGGGDVTALLRTNNLADLDDVATARGNLGLGDGATFDVATAAEYRNDTADKLLDVDTVWDAATPVALADSGGNIALDLDSGINFTMTMDGDYTLSAPTNAKPGQCGCIEFTQDGTGTQTLTIDAAYILDPAGDYTLSTAASSLDLMFYQVLASGSVFLSPPVKAVA